MENNKNDYKPAEQDSAWKDILDVCFEDFIEFFFPALYQDIDFTTPPEFLDKELQKIRGENSEGKRYVDKLVKVLSKYQEELWFLVHVEVQATREPGLAERLFRYNYRIFERYSKKAITLLILSDEEESYKPKSYTDYFHGMYTEFRFPSVKLLDYRENRSILQQSKNPFALAVLAFLRYIDNKGQPVKLFEVKKELVDLLFERGYTKDRINALFKFIDWIIRLPEQLDEKLEDKIKQERGDKYMAYVTSWERRAEKRGREEGIQQGELLEKQHVLIRQADTKFGLTEEEKDKIRACKDADKLDAALDTVLTATVKNEVLGVLE